MSDTNRVAILYKRQTAFATQATGNYDTLRYSSESLKLATETVRSGEIVSDRQVTRVIRTQIEPQGGFSGEFSFSDPGAGGVHKGYDEFMVAALLSGADASQADFPATILETVASDVSVTAPDLFDSAGTLFTAGVGDYIYVRGMTNAVNNGFFIVTGTPLTSQIQVAYINGDVPGGDGAILVTEAAGATKFLHEGGHISNGTCDTGLNAFTVEKEFTDKTNEFSRFIGNTPASITIETNADQLVTFACDFLGKDEVGTDGTGRPGTSSGGTAVAIPDTQQFNAIDNVTAILEGGVSTEVTEVTAFSFTLTSNLRQRKVIGTRGNISLGSGVFGATGTLTILFEDADLVDKYLAFDTVDLAIAFEEVHPTDGNLRYLFHFPACKLTDCETVAGGQDQEVVATFTFEAFKDVRVDDAGQRLAGIDKTCQISRFGPTA